MDGGPPDCPIRACAKGRGYELRSERHDLGECGKFNWLGDYAKELKARLFRSGGRSKPGLIDENIEQL